MGFDFGGLVSGAGAGMQAGAPAGPWGAAIGGGLGAISGGLFGGSERKPTQSELLSEDIASKSRGLLNAGPVEYFGDSTVGLTPGMTGVLGGMESYAGAGGLAPGIQEQYSQYGQSLMPGGYQAGQYYQNQLSGVGIPQAQVDMAQVEQYANNPYLNQQIEAANTGYARQLQETELPGSRMAAARAGQTGSSRHGLQEGIAQRGAADRMAATEAQMRGDAYRQGMSQQQQMAQYNTGLQAQTQANAAAQAAAGAQLGLENQMGGYGFGWENLGAQYGVQDIYRQDLQQQRQDEYDEWQYGKDAPWELINRAKGAVGQYSPAQEQPNSFSQGLSALGSLGGAFDESGMMSLFRGGPPQPGDRDFVGPVQR